MSLRREIEEYLIRLEEFLTEAYALFEMASALGEEPPAETVVAVAEARRIGDDLREMAEELDRAAGEE
jgi:hypothetical protein